MTAKEEVAKILNAFIDEAPNFESVLDYANSAKERFHEIKGIIQDEVEVGEIPSVPEPA